MANVGIELSDCCNYLDSDKVIERRKRLEELKLILENSASVELLHKNSENDRGLVWDTVFGTVHKSLLKELERHIDEKTKKGKPLPATEKCLKTCCGLIITVLTKANSGKSRVSCDIVFSCILQVLENWAISEVILDSYLHLLSLSFNSKQYCGEVKFDFWKDLFTNCLVVFQEVKSDRTKSVILSILNIIILQAARFSPLIPKAKNLLKEFPNIMKRVTSSKSPQMEMNTLQLSLTICQQFGKEYRLSVCKFGEDIIPHLMNINETRTTDLKFKETLFKLLVEIVMVHSPWECVEEERMAFCEETWSKQRHFLYRLCKKELSTLARSSHSLATTHQVVVLAVRLAKQLFSNVLLNEDVSPDAGPSSKRVKLSSGVMDVLDSITEMPELPWTWLYFLDLLLDKAPESVLEEDFVPLLNFVSEQLTRSNNPLCLKYLSKCSIHLLTIKQLFFNNKFESNTQEFHGVVWITVFRCMKGEGEVSWIGHELATQLMCGGWASQDSLKTLTELYLSDKVQLTLVSLDTLTSITTTGCVSTSTVRCRLLNWAFQGEMFSASAFMGLLFKRKPYTPQPSEPGKAHNFREPAENFYISSALGLPPQSHGQQTPVETNCLLEDKEAFDEFLKLTAHQFTQNKRLTYNLPLMSSLISLLTSIRSYGSISNKLNEIIIKVIPQVWTQVEDAISIYFTEDFTSDKCILDSLRLLLNQLSHQPHLITETFYQSIGDVLINLLKFHHFKNNDAVRTDASNEDLEIKILKTLLNLIESSSNQLDIIKMFSELLTISKNQILLSSTSGFHIATLTIEKIIQQDGLNEKIMKDVLSVEKKLCNNWYLYHDEFIIILDILTDTVKLVFTYDSNQNDLKSQLCLLASSFRKLITEKKYGAQIVSKFVKFIGRIAQFDTEVRCKIEMKDKADRIVILHLIDYLNSPFHESDLKSDQCQDGCRVIFRRETFERKQIIQQRLISSTNKYIRKMYGFRLMPSSAQSLIETGDGVRMATAELIPGLFSTEAAALHQQRALEEAFQNSLKASEDLFFVKEGTSIEDVKEEGSNRSCCALKILLGLIYSSPKWRRRALYKLFRLIFAKNIDISLVRRVHRLLVAHFKLDNIVSFLEQNVDFILWHWYKEDKSFETFPFYCMDFKSREEFFSEYKSIMLPILCENDDMKNLNALSSALHLSVKDMVLECYPEVMSCLLPKLGSDETVAKGRALYELMEKIIGGDSLKSALTTKLDQVILAIFMRLFDPQHLDSVCDHSPRLLPSSAPLSITFSEVQSALQYLQRSSPNQKQSLVVFLCINRPSHIHYTLHTLSSNIFIATTTEIRTLCFHQYLAFCDSLGRELVQSGRMRGYIIRHVIHCLLHLVQTDLKLLAFTYLHRFIGLCLPDCIKHINPLTDLIKSTIVSISETPTPEGDKCRNILELLNWENPSRELSDEQTSTLREEVVLFLINSHISIQSLSRLSSQLSKRKKELCQLYEDVALSRGFSEDCSKSLPHRLISRLVRLAHSNDQMIRELAGRCLGQIGPRDLSTLGLEPENCEEPLPFANFTHSLLSPILFHNDSELSEAAATSIKELFLTKEGLEAFDGLDEIESSYVVPFLPPSRKPRKALSGGFSMNLNDWPSIVNSHGTWVSTLTSCLLKSFKTDLLPLLAPIALKLVNFSEKILPHIVYMIAAEHPESFKPIEERINEFFRQHFDIRRSRKTYDENSYIYMNRLSVQCVLSIVNFHRLKTSGLTPAQKQNPVKLNVNYLHVAWAAHYCKAYFTSLLYSELWADVALAETPFSDDEVIALSPLELISKYKLEEGKDLLNLLWEDYKEIGERDGMEGCAKLQLGEPEARLRYFREMGLWQKLVEEAELARPKQTQALAYGYLMNGQYMSASRVGGCWEAAWRMAEWDFDQPSPGHDDPSYLHYSALKCALWSKDKEGALRLLETERSLVIKQLEHASLEVAASIYNPLAALKLITEAEDWCTGEREVGEVFGISETRDWVHSEPLLWQRGLLYGSDQHWLAAAATARASDAHLVARRFLQNIKENEVTKNILDKAKYEETKVHWESGDAQTAKYLLNQLLHRVRDPLLKSSCLLTYGTWMSETKSESPKEIIQKYFEEAAILCHDNKQGRIAAAECLARYADSEFQRISQYINSSEYEIKETGMKESREKLEAFKSRTSDSLDMEERKVRKMLEVQVEIDQNETTAINKESSAYLRCAIREYLSCLRLGDVSSDKIFRLISLWLSNHNRRGLKEELDSQLKLVPSYKFIPVFPQLVVRHSLESTHFSTTLASLLFRCSEEHPHHCLWHLLALAHSDKDQPNPDPQPQPRVLGARALMHKLARSQKVGNIVSSMKDLALAYISLANWELPARSRPGEYKMSKKEPLTKVSEMAHVSCITVNLPVVKKAEYSDIIGILGFEEMFVLVGGINQPKKVMCLCTDGVKRDQLVKGKDDMRQDAVMQQVFSVLNDLLAADKSSAARKLTVRTYKVIPLSQKSGVIEWCRNTEPIGHYLIKAHSRHRPRDFSQSECRDLMEKIASTLSHEDKKQIFLKICSNFKPVMRHFFLEKYTTPGIWYERRLAYSRSVATNSMIGYILGIGDRHVNNILIDVGTAEVIHIDFGIAFELGKILPTPETVPFRLTRDIEDGMGVARCQGVFRRCCEETIRVLRKCSEPVLTTLEVLLYDPVCTWAVAHRSNHSQQSIPNIGEEVGGGVERNKLAERALQRLRQKLEGREEGGGDSSVEGQVNRLIQEARDPGNLCRLFRGWQAYL